MFVLDYVLVPLVMVTISLLVVSIQEMYAQSSYKHKMIVLLGVTLAMLLFLAGVIFKPSFENVDNFSEMPGDNDIVESIEVLAN